MNNNIEFCGLLQKSLIDAAQQAETKKSDAREPRVINRVWPTEASAVTPVGIIGRCRRSTFYSQRNISTTQNDMNSLGRFQAGRDIEEWVRNLTTVSGTQHAHSIKIRYPNPYNDKLIISGEIDLIYKFGDKYVGGEIKSSYGYQFHSRVFPKSTVPGLPKEANLLQTLLYLYYLKHVDTSLGVDSFIITYLDRGSMEIMHHMIELSDKMVPIINGITMENIDDYGNPVYNTPGINEKKTHDKLVTCEFNLRNVFERFAEIYDYHESGLLIPRDYEPLYTDDMVETKYRAGEISKTAYANYTEGRVAQLCDSDCNWCQYRQKCLKDDGIII